MPRSVKKLTTETKEPIKTRIKIPIEFSLQKFFQDSKSYTPILLVLLLVASFLLGALTTKLATSQNSTGNPQTATQPNTPAAAPNVPNQPPPSGAKVKVDNGHLPFLGQESTWAAEASECANEQGKFWEFHDYLFKNQQGENQEAFSKDKLIGFAGALGLNTDQFSSCLNSEKYAKNVSDDLSAGQKAGVSGTPTTFVNGQTVVGAQPYSAFKTLIDQELSKV